MGTLASLCLEALFGVRVPTLGYVEVQLKFGMPYGRSCICGHFTNPKGPRTQIIGSQGPNSINVIVFGP